MSENQTGRLSDSPSSGLARKPDSQLRLALSEKVVIPGDGKATDDAATIISKNKPKASTSAISAGEVLAGRNLRGQRLAHFELLEPIGIGGMAAVIRARDTQLDRFVALKILPPEMASDHENVRRFHQEAKAAAKLDHVNIARVFFCGEDKDLHFIAFEYVEGDNLRTLLERRGRLPVAEAVRYVLQVAAGLEHAATRGVVHRDIKPSNIIITPQGQAKLVDMGLARNAETHSDQALTQSGVTLGTFDYISPEQALEPREADVRSDIYSLGCTFYHMLTGQPPVPEGTAAKKLYHHQHLAPIDPRQINRDIPDEIAAILMRMMAKDPAERYQRPVHLIHHLAQVAERMGATTGTSEGVMFLDAPLPGAPRFRPIVTIGLAALGLAILLVLVSLAPPQKGSGLQPPPIVPQGPGEAKGPTPPNGPTPGLIVPGPAVTEVVANSEQLERILKDTDKKRSGPVLVEKDIDLGDGLPVWKGKQPLVFKAENSATLRFTYKNNAGVAAQGDAAQEGTMALNAGLVIDSTGPVTFENLRFELNSQGMPSHPVAMIALRGKGLVTFRRCTFVQNVPALERTRMDIPFSSVLLENTSEDMDEARKHCHANFFECYWEKGGEAGIALNGYGKVAVTNCAFAPCDALFYLFGGNRDIPSELSLTRCSALLAQGPAFRLDEFHACKLDVKQSIFSYPDGGGDGQLILQTQTDEPLVVDYKGQRNVYHNLKSLWAMPGEGSSPDVKIALEAFRAKVGVSDADSVALSVSPWTEASPLKKLSKHPKEAFQVSTKLAEVRTADGKRALGIDKCVWGPMTSLPPLAADVVAPPVVRINPNEKIIDPDAGDDQPGVYSSLAKAIPFSKPGDVLLIKHGKKSREVSLKGLTVDEPNVDLVLKPYPDNHPVLVLSTPDKGAAMFRLFDGKLQFENLEFTLEPDAQDTKGQTVVALSSNGSCAFKNCVVSLKQGERRLSLSVVSLLDLDDVMKMPTGPNTPPAPPRSQPQINFTDCLVRGEGDLVSVKSSRPFELKVDNSVAALAGSLLVVQGAGKEINGEMVMPAVIKLSRVTAFLTEPCILLRGKAMHGLVPTRCEPVRDCLFVSMGKRPFIALDGIDVGPDMLRQFLEWKGERNAYVNMDRMLEIARTDDTTSLGNLDVDDWASKMETEAHFEQRVRAAVMPKLSFRPFSQMKLEEYRLGLEYREKLVRFGATLETSVLPPFSTPLKLEAANP